MSFNKTVLIAAIGLVISLSTPPTFAGCGSKAELNCMIATINGEARGEPYKGMLVVGKTLKTRKLRGYYGKTICKISKRGFAPRSLRSTGTKGKTKARIIKAANAACASGDAGYTHFHSYRTKYTRNAPWAKDFKYKGRVGGHWLFNAPRGIKADFDTSLAFNNELITEESFFTEVDQYYYEASDTDANNSYREEDDQEIEGILSTPIDTSISI